MAHLERLLECGRDLEQPVEIVGVARAPARQTARADEAESAELLWLAPARALDKARALKLLPVTRRTLTELGGFADVAAVLAEAQRPGREMPLTMPRIGLGAKPLARRRRSR